VLAPSQLSRDAEKREDKHRQLADLCNSGVIGQDVYVVCFTYPVSFLERHTGWENGLKEVGNIMEVIIVEQHMGTIGVEKLSFNPELA
jgi:replicative DNA helicase